MTTLLRDVRYSARLLYRAPGFTIVAVLTLGLGIGATTAIVSVLHAVLLRSLPYRDADRLVVIGHAQAEPTPGNAGYLTIADWRGRARSFDAIVAIRSWAVTLTGEREPEEVRGMRVSWDFFRMLGVRPALGRDFSPEEDRLEQWRVLILSDRLWRRRFDADPSIVGKTVQVLDRRFVVAGVLPPAFEPLISSHFYAAADVWAPLGYDASLPYACRGCQHLKALGRIRPGATLDRARAELTAIQRVLRAEHPTEYDDGGVALRPLEDELVGSIRPTLYVLMGAVGLVLLIACANIAGLLLARGAHRRREFAIRTALGAAQTRLVRQLLTEATVLSLLGGIAGLAIGNLTIRLLLWFQPAGLPRADQIAIRPEVLGFCAAVSILCGMLCGVAPAYRVASGPVQDLLRAAGRAAATGRGRRVLVATEVALAVILLAGAGLMVKSMARLLRVDPGFDPRNVLTMSLSIVGPAYREDPSVVVFQERLLERVRGLPGVRAAAIAGQIPLGGNMDRWGFHVEGRRLANPAEAPSVERYSVTPEYFRVMSIRLVRGRPFTAADRAGVERVMIVGETTARELWPGQDPLGRRVRLGDGRDPAYTIIGIAGDVRHYELATPPTMQMYLPQAQVTDLYVELVVRTTGNPGDLAQAVRHETHAIGPTVAVTRVSTMEALVGRSVSQRRFAMTFVTLFAATALVMAAIGLYGLIAYSVAQRTAEFGIRVALGARPVDVVGLVFREGTVLALAGVASGIVAAVFLTRVLAGLLYEVSPTDPPTLAAIVALVIAVIVLAQLVPALRAIAVDPSRALQAE